MLGGNPRLISPSIDVPLASVQVERTDSLEMIPKVCPAAAAGVSGAEAEPDNFSEEYTNMLDREMLEDVVFSMETVSGHRLVNIRNKIMNHLYCWQR